MAKVWVQVWTARVAGSVEVEESALREVVSDFQKLIPMLVKVSEHSGWETVPNWGKQLVSVEEKVEVLPPLELVQDLETEKEREYREKAQAKGWGWVLGLEGHQYKQD